MLSRRNLFLNSQVTVQYRTRTRRLGIPRMVPVAVTTVFLGRGYGRQQRAVNGAEGGAGKWQEAVIRPYQTIPDSFTYFQMFSDTYVHHINTFGIYSEKFGPLQKLVQDLSKFGTGSETCSELSFSQMISDHFAVGLHWA